MKVELQASYVLNAKPYLETSLLLEIFSREHGRISMVARGIKRSKIAKIGMLQPFNKLLLSWCGKGPLYTMTAVELTQEPIFFRAKKLVQGLYLNELLIKLLAISDPYPELFDCYYHTIQKINSTSMHNTNQCSISATLFNSEFNSVNMNMNSGNTLNLSTEQEQITLRLFEKTLLITLGYALPLIKNILTGEMVQPECYYIFDLEQGPTLVKSLQEKLATFAYNHTQLSIEQRNKNSKIPYTSSSVVDEFELPKQAASQQLSKQKIIIFKGSSLLALHNEQFSSKEELLDAKRLMRAALALRLEDQKLRTRELC